MAESVRIEAVTLKALRGDQDALYARWADPYAIARMTEEKRRALLSNPLRGEPGQVVQLLAVKGEFGAGAAPARVIGRLDLVRAEVVVDGKPVAALWGSDWSVPEAERGSMAAISLLMQMQRLTAPDGIVGAHGPSNQAVPVYQKMKWTDLALRRLILVRRARSVVERYVGAGVKGALARALCAAGLAAHGAALSIVTRWAARGLTARVADEFPAEWERLLPGDSARAGGHRSATYINWWLGNSFFAPVGGRARNRNVLVLVERRGVGGRTEPAGYIVCKARFHEFATHRRLPNLLLGSVQDWASFAGGGGRHGPSWAALFLLGARELSRVGVDAVEVCVDERHGEGARGARALRRLGFVPVGEFRSLWKASRGSPLADAAFADSANWRLRPGDGDTFFT